ncbi:MAG: zinc ABC transporter substrate-binding protein [Alistipes sp.]|nr:zinc ABC transporter substrate-binding protein [Alistipes sp.]
MKRRLAIFISIITLLCSCKGDNNHTAEKTIFVSISPLKMLAEEITCGDFPVEVLVPEGASPETYDPTARQLTEASQAQLLLSTGLITFEQSLVDRIANKERIVDLSSGITLLAGSCTHNHSHSHMHHTHGIDPHIWTSPRALTTMVRTMHKRVMALYPDSTKYDVAAGRLLERIEQLDTRCQESIEASETEAFMIYHPAYTYYAHDYGIRQISVEQDGKEPSPRQLALLVEEVKRHNIKAILLQPQYSIDKVMSLAEECGIEVIVTDPLATDILSEIERVTTIICGVDEQ